MYWGGYVGKTSGTVSTPAKYVFAGARSVYLQGQTGQHDSLGAGEHAPATTVGTVYFRVYLRLEDGFTMGSCNQLKLFAIRGGSDLSQTYGGAGVKPTGYDKFSALLGIDTQSQLHFYYYHPDQSSIYGDITYCNATGATAKVSRASGTAWS